MEEMNELNRKLHEAFGHEVHECVEGNWDVPFRCSCGFTTNDPEEMFKHLDSNPVPDYCADPRLVIREMEAAGRLKGFLDYGAGMYFDKDEHLDEAFLVWVDLILDTTGKLARLALEWLKGEVWAT